MEGNILEDSTKGAKKDEITSRNLLERIAHKWHSLEPEERVYVTQLGLLAATQAVDVLTTYVGLTTSGGALSEKGILAGAMLESGGFAALSAIKLSGAASIAAIAEGCRRSIQGNPAPLNISLRLANSITTGIAVCNTAHIIGLL